MSHFQIHQSMGFVLVIFRDTLADSDTMVERPRLRNVI